jgi:hypothetical protein
MEWEDPASEQKPNGTEALPFDRISSSHADHTNLKSVSRGFNSKTFPKQNSKVAPVSMGSGAAVIPEESEAHITTSKIEDLFTSQMSASFVPKLSVSKTPTGQSPPKPSSARGTRREELEYLSSILGSRTHRGMRTVRLPSHDDNAEETLKDGSQTARTRPAHGRQADTSHDYIGSLKSAGFGKKLSFSSYKTLYDVATFSEFPSSQDFAGGGVAALCTLSRERESLYSSGAVKYMLDLLINGKSLRSKCDACDALTALVKSKCVFFVFDLEICFFACF